MRSESVIRPVQALSAGSSRCPASPAGSDDAGSDAVAGEGADALYAGITEALSGDMVEAQLQLDFNDGRKRAWLFERGLVEGERQTDTGFDLTVRWNTKQEAQFRQL